ncbi:dienelactone hydrolase family protein [Streptomyces sp. NPDC046887]|uniref:dienelactone hydrolase family protein n=1 Tax=Streptomyces sp. NPDC046887 TaxID=3155472 RepID=UPI003408F0BA
MAEQFTGDHGIAVVVAHEIHGVNEHIAGVARALRRYPCDVHTPDFRPEAIRPGPTGHTGQTGQTAVTERRAYQDFMRHLGVEGMARALAGYAEGLRSRYRAVYCVGYSVGATAAWLAAEPGVLDRTVCFYGSRIRDHIDLPPRSGCLVVVAEQEASFSGGTLAEKLVHRGDAAVELYPCAHGFCDPGNPHYSPQHSAAAWESAVGFLGFRGGS